MPAAPSRPSPGWSIDERAIAPIASALGELGVDRQAGPDRLGPRRAAAARSPRAAPVDRPPRRRWGALLASLRTPAASCCTAAAVDRHAGGVVEAGVYISVGPKVGEDLRLLSAVPDHLLLLVGCEQGSTAVGHAARAAAARQTRFGSIKALISDNYRRFLKGA